MDSAPTQPAKSKVLAIGVLGVAVLAVAAPVGYFVWDRARQPDPRELTDVIPTSAYLFGFGRPNRAPIDGIRQARNGTYVARSGAYQLNATKDPKTSDWTIRLTTTRNDLLTADQQAALAARFRLVADAAYAKSLSVSADQIKSLKAIPVGTSMEVAAPSEAQLKQLLDSYLSAANKAEAENAIVRAVGEIGAASVEATKKELAERADKIHAVLTEAQLKPFKN